MESLQTFKHSANLDLRVLRRAYGDDGIFKRAGYAWGQPLYPYNERPRVREVAVRFDAQTLYNLEMDEILPKDNLDFVINERAWRRIEPGHERRLSISSDATGTKAKVFLKHDGIEVTQEYINQIVANTLGIEVDFRKFFVGREEHRKMEVVRKEQLKVIDNEIKLWRSADQNLLEELYRELRGDAPENKELKPVWEGNWKVPRYTAKFKGRIITFNDAIKICRLMEKNGAAELDVDLCLYEFEPEQLDRLMQIGVPPQSVVFLISSHKKTNPRRELAIYFTRNYYDKNTGKFEVLGKNFASQKLSIGTSADPGQVDTYRSQSLQDSNPRPEDEDAQMSIGDIHAALTAIQVDAPADS